MTSTRRALSSVLCLAAAVTAAGCDSLLKSAECTTDGDCSPGHTCVAGVCEALPVECVVDSDCGTGSICREGSCEGALVIGDGDGDGDGSDRTVVVDPGYELDFGSPVLGVGIDRVVAFTNGGDAAFEVTSAALSATTSSEYAVTTEPALPVTLYPGDRVEVTVAYTLVDGQDDQGLLTVTTTADGCSPACPDASAIEVELISEFKGGRELGLAPVTHDFGYVPAGGQSAVSTLLLTNVGTLDKVLTVETLTIGGDAAEFTFSVPALPLFLAPGESVEVPVVYAPTTSAALHEVTFTVEANSDSPPNRVLTATFRGTAQPPNALVWVPPELVFPNLTVGSSAQLQTRLENQGGMPIQVTGLQFGNAQPPASAAEYSYAAFANGFAVTFPRTVLPGGYLDVYVEYASQTGQPSITAIAALNDQVSGDVPVLTLRGESFMPPGGPILDVISGPETQLDTGCGCQATENVPAANVDLTYRAVSGGQTCGKPANPACGTGGVNCQCPAMSTFGNVRWGGARVEEVRGETWIIDEAIHHDGAGQDSSFVVRADLLDNCLAVPGSTSYSVNHACCMWVDCETGAQACFEYTSDYPHCATECQYLATQATSQDCLARGPVAVRTTVRISNADGSVVEEKAYCSTHGSSGVGTDVVTVSRQAGYFQILGKAAGVVEVGPSQPCPAP